jgi:NitT/TauT family transport system permease protein
MTPAADQTALALSKVACTFVSRDDPGQRYTAVSDVTLTVAAGEFVSVVGPTGCGKSTLLNVAAGLLAPSVGTVQVFGQPLEGINQRAGYMFQTESLMPWRTALGNVMAGLEFRGVPDAQERAGQWLRQVGLGGFGDRYPHQLSGGMRKRTSLAQTLALDPDIILMDEKGRLVHHPRPRRSHRHERPRGGAVGRPGQPPDWRVRRRPGAPARRGRDQDEPPLHRTARRHLGRAARRGAQGLRATTQGGQVNKPRHLWVWQLALLLALFGFWHAMTAPGLVPNFMFENDRQAAFFFGEPVKVLGRVWAWFVTSGDIYRHLGVTLVETLLAFGVGSVLGLLAGLWLALSPLASAILEPYVKALNAMPRIILAPIFSVWFGLGIASKVALGVTLVFFIVFFNVYQGVKEVSPVVLANARMLGASKKQLLRHVYLPSAMSWVFSSLHTSVGLAFVGAVVGEYLGSSQGVGYLILQAEGTFDINTVMAGILVLTVFALVLDAAVGQVERRLMKWQPRAGETEKL